MPALTDEQRAQRRVKLQNEALESVAARGQFNFRLDGKDIKRLHALAGKRKKAVTAMVREWVLQRLEIEETAKHLAPPWAKELEQRLSHTEAFVLLALSSLGSSSAKHDKQIKSKLRNHMKQHWKSKIPYIQTDKIMQLTAQDRETFINALLNHPEPSDNLKAAAKRYFKHIGS
jgi:hypothetical protein